MRHRVEPAVGLVVLLLAGAPASASEMFLCADGRMLHVTNANRAKLAEDPCVKAWFGTDRKPAPAPAPAVATAAVAATATPEPVADKAEAEPDTASGDSKAARRDRETGTRTRVFRFGRRR